MDEMVWDVQARDARLLGTPDPAPDIMSLLARLPGTQAHEHADAILAGIRDSAESSDQDRHRLMAGLKSRPAPAEASPPEAAPPKPFQAGEFEIYSGTESGTDLALESTPPWIGQAEP